MESRYHSVLNDRVIAGFHFHTFPLSILSSVHK